MESIISRLAKDSLLLHFIGVISIILSVFNYSFRLFSWLDVWKNTSRWIIQTILIIDESVVFLLFGIDLDVEVDVSA